MAADYSQICQHDAEQGAAPDRLQLRSFLAALPAAGELGRCAAARGLVVNPQLCHNKWNE